jgi:hypothetical protein
MEKISFTLNAAYKGESRKNARFAYTCPNLQDKESLAHIMGLSDKANGYVFAKLAEGSPVPPEYLYGSTVKVSIMTLITTLPT